MYLDSPNRCLKLTAMKFIGGILQDYFTDLCFYLKKGDVKTLKKCKRRATLSRMGTPLMLEQPQPLPRVGCHLPLEN